MNRQCPVTWPERVGTGWTQEVPLNIRKLFFLLWGWPGACTGHTGKSWILHPWRYFKTICMWTTGSSLDREVGPDDHHGSLPTLNILSCCDLVWVKVPSPALTANTWTLASTVQEKTNAQAPYGFLLYSITSKKCICYWSVPPYGNYHLKCAVGKCILHVEYCIYKIYSYWVYSEI